MDDVVWLSRARRNLNDIGDYIAQDNPQAAQRVVRKIVEQVTALTFYPRIGREGRIAGTRELVIADTPYVAVYRLKERIEILLIRHGAQRWPE